MADPYGEGPGYDIQGGPYREGPGYDDLVASLRGESHFSVASLWGESQVQPHPYGERANFSSELSNEPQVNVIEILQDDLNLSLLARIANFLGMCIGLFREML
ncbi:hypothetical protein Tco_0349527 [Tanacetum coccineum]